MTDKSSRYTSFITQLAQDGCFFVFLLVVLTVFRAVFLALFADTLAPNTPFSQIALTFWYGLRISLKTAGACVLPAFVFGTVLSSVWPKWNGEKFRFYWTCFVLVVLSILLQTRIPYYQEFHSAFSPFIFNTFHDDVGAIVGTSISQYHAVEHTIIALICAAVLCWLCRLLLKKVSPWLARPLLQVRRPWVAVVVISILLVPFAVWVRHGGAFTFNKSIYWKNAARLDQHVLNETVLDDIQALYRAKSIYKQLRKSATKVSVQKTREAAARLTGQAAYTAPDLLPLLARIAPGGKRPKHIFLIVAETYMMWPLLDEYKNYPLAQGMRQLLTRQDAALADRFLPASNGTMFGLTTLVLGLPELNVHASDRPTAQKPYETALSVQLRANGYKTRFFYGGFPSWNNVGSFMNNQQFDESFYAANFSGQSNVWGVADREFLQGVPAFIGDEPSFNLILTSSNHPPYKVDMSREPDLPTVADFERMLPAQTADKSLVAARMWHFAYADKYLAEFIQTMLAKYPDSLFVITGDHADRWTLLSSPSDYERLAVPAVFIGPAVRSLPTKKAVAASHMDIAATVLEMTLPKGTPYYALGKNLFAFATRETAIGVSAYDYITQQELGRIHEPKVETLPGEQPLTAAQRGRVLQQVKDIQTVTAWRILNGTELK